MGASDSGMAMQPSVNFYHPSGRKFLLQSQSKTVFVKYGMDPIYIRDTGTRQLPVRLRFCPLMRASRLAFQSAF
jgi:hypothetical protein